MAGCWTENCCRAPFLLLGHALLLPTCRANRPRFCNLPCLHAAPAYCAWDTAPLGFSCLSSSSPLPNTPLPVPHTFLSHALLFTSQHPLPSVCALSLHFPAHFQFVLLPSLLPTHMAPSTTSMRACLTACQHFFLPHYPYSYCIFSLYCPMPAHYSCHPTHPAVPAAATLLYISCGGMFLVETMPPFLIHIHEKPFQIGTPTFWSFSPAPFSLCTWVVGLGLGWC